MERAMQRRARVMNLIKGKSRQSAERL